MKKFSKILTVLLTVCLLAGVVTATVVSAADETPPYTSIKEYAAGKPYKTGGTFSQTLMTTTEGNEYYRHSATASGTSNYSYFRGSNAADFGNYDYVVWDLDFTADQYLNESGALVAPESVSSTEDLKLSYTNALRFYHERFGTAPTAYIVEGTGDDAGKWFASTGSAYNPGSGRVHIPLEEEVGIWNHLTWVLDVVNKYVHIYINGKYLSSTSVTDTQLDTTDRYFYLRPHSDSSGNFSVGIDNVKETGFLKDYTPAEGIYSIKTLLDGSVDTSIPIYECDDMYYNSKYTYANAPAGQALATVNGTEYYVSLEAAINALKDSALTGEVTIETRKSIENAKISENVTPLKVKCTDGATFSAEGFSPAGEADANGYVTYTKAVKVNATWYGTDGQQVAASEVNVGNPVEIPEEAVNAYAAIKGTKKYEWSSDNWETTTKFDLSTGIESVPEGTAAISIRPAVATVTWKGVAGKVDDVAETWYVGSTLEDRDLSGFPVVPVIEGWTARKYIGWDGFVKGATVEQSAEYTPVLSEEAFAAVSYKANITLLSKYLINIYVPVPAENSGITDVTFGNLFETTIDGVDYYQASSDGIDFRASKGNFTATISFTADGVDYTDTLTVNTIDYLNNVIDKYNGPDREEAMRLVVNFANFIHQCAVINEGAETEFKNIVDTNSQYLNTDVTGTAASGNTGCAVTYQLYKGSSGTGTVRYVYLVLLVPTDIYGENPTVTATYKGIANNLTNKEISVDFGSANSTLITNEQKEGYKVFVMDSYDIYNLLEPITITIDKDADGNADATHTHLFTDYIGFLEANSATEEYAKALPVVESLYGFAKAAKEFKMYGVEQQ